MAIRQGTCETCGGATVSGLRGPVPRFCPGHRPGLLSPSTAAERSAASSAANQARWARIPAEARSAIGRAAATARWAGHAAKLRRLHGPPAPCRYCATPLPTMRGAVCQAAECRRRYNADRMRSNDYNARSRAKLGRPAGTRAADTRRRAAMRGAEVGEPFTIEQVLDRDGWTCDICHEPIDPAEAYPSRLSLSLDHVLPIIRGGAHSFDNVRPAHLGCNSSRGAAAA